MTSDRIFGTPPLEQTDLDVIADVHAMRASLADVLRVPRRWTGGLRRTTQARALKGSNSIEGYVVTAQDALAAVDQEAPLDADRRTWAEIMGYRRMMTYVLTAGARADGRVSADLLRVLHYMLLEHDLEKSPGGFRAGPIYIRESTTGKTVYEAPDAEMVPQLIDSLVASIEHDRAHRRPKGNDPMVRAAMAHLNLVMIHPYRDGNGRMSRALQTLVLAQGNVLEPTFCSIEEWLGDNTDDYYRVLAATGRGSWHPENNATLWLRFNLRAHHLQAQMLQRRFREADETWVRLDDLVRQHGLPDRTADALFEATLGNRVTRPGYMRRTTMEERTATRDLVRLAELGLLRPFGKARGRYYVAGTGLDALQSSVLVDRRPLDDPYPWLAGELRRLAP
ncbi:Fic family protein [Antribacter gilvus]|uniref:Fic family protein n=1 Tax=Antribacter gilvus TaxID=2304675 RepID=UPI000F76B996|nr:Fic family protein [Antribacter gilvus]